MCIHLLTFSNTFSNIRAGSRVLTLDFFMQLRNILVWNDLPVFSLVFFWNNRSKIMYLLFSIVKNISFIIQSGKYLLFSYDTVGLNQFSDMTFAEFKKFYLLKEPQVLCVFFAITLWHTSWTPKVCVSSGVYVTRLFCPTWQECNATKGNHVGGAGVLPDSIDWREKGNFVSEVKNQVMSYTVALKSTQHPHLFPTLHTMLLA